MGPEARVERSLVLAVRRQGGLCLKWVSPGVVGVPDRIVLLPGRAPMFVEVKAPGGRLSAAQERMHDELRLRGAEVRVVWNQEDIDGILK